MSNKRSVGKYVILTADDCPQCERLGKMLTKLKAVDHKAITYVDKQQPELFNALVYEYGIKSLPALICRPHAQVLRDCSSLSTVQRFFEETA